MNTYTYSCVLVYPPWFTANDAPSLTQPDVDCPQALPGLWRAPKAKRPRSYGPEPQSLSESRLGALHGNPYPGLVSGVATVDVAGAVHRDAARLAALGNLGRFDQRLRAAMNGLTAAALVSDEKRSRVVIRETVSARHHQSIIADPIPDATIKRQCPILFSIPNPIAPEMNACN